jgi:hypothetical protein
MTDLIDVAAPLGLLGQPFERLLSRYLERLLTRRNAAIARAATRIA